MILFKVDIKSKIESPQFQKNFTYVEVKIKDFWQKFILNPLKLKGGEKFKGFVNKWENDMTQNLFNVTTDKKIEDILN